MNMNMLYNRNLHLLKSQRTNLFSSTLMKKKNDKPTFENLDQNSIEEGISESSLSDEDGQDPFKTLEDGLKVPFSMLLGKITQK